MTPPIIDIHIHIQPLHMFKPEPLALIKKGRKDYADVEKYSADPKAFLGPAQGPPPIARRPTGKARSESHESHIPVLYLFRMISLRGATEVSGIFKV